MYSNIVDNYVNTPVDRVGIRNFSEHAIRAITELSVKGRLNILAIALSWIQALGLWCYLFVLSLT